MLAISKLSVVNALKEGSGMFYNFICDNMDCTLCLWIPQRASLMFINPPRRFCWFRRARIPGLFPSGVMPDGSTQKQGAWTINATDKNMPKASLSYWNEDCNAAGPMLVELRYGALNRIAWAFFLSCITQITFLNIVIVKVQPCLCVYLCYKIFCQPISLMQLNKLLYFSCRSRHIMLLQHVWWTNWQLYNSHEP